MKYKCKVKVYRNIGDFCDNIEVFLDYKSENKIFKGSIFIERFDFLCRDRKELDKLKEFNALSEEELISTMTNKLKKEIKNKNKDMFFDEEVATQIKILKTKQSIEFETEF